MAEARSAVHEPHVVSIDEGKDTLHDVVRAWKRSMLRRFFRTRNSIRNGLWPTHIYNLGVTTGAVTLVLYKKWTWAEPLTDTCNLLAEKLNIPPGIPPWIRLPLVAFSFGFSSFLVLLYVRRYALRAMLAYRGWMYEPPKQQSWRTIIWAVTVRVISGYSPSLYSYQASLPKQPVPPLKDTLRGLIESLKPVYGEDSQEINELKKQSKEFEQTIGKKLQRILSLKSWWAQNYVTDWWEKYVYLMGRDSLINNSNYYILDHSYWTPTHLPAARAANAVYQVMLTKRSLDRETLDPLVIRNTIPVCMAQYERIFNTTRIPGEEIDELYHMSSSIKAEHIIVMSKGHFYKVYVFDKHDNLLPPTVLEEQFNFIIEDSHKQDISDVESHLAALTAWDRTNWARVRKEHFQSGVNKVMLDAIETAVFVVTFANETPAGFTGRGKLMLHGNGASIWADKSFNLMFFDDGHMGNNGEHSWADAPVLGHAMEFHYSNEAAAVVPMDSESYRKALNYPPMYDPINGHALNYNLTTGQSTTVSDSSRRREPQRLIWECNDKLGRAIETAYEFSVKNNNDLDLIVRDHNYYGKGVIKCFKVSPDAYIQLAIHLAYYKLHKKFVLTYESSMTRLFLCGRTETVRSLTQLGVDFILAMVAGDVDRGLKIRLLRRACEAHQKLYRDAMAGKGIDRHLFALYVLAQGLGHESQFLKHALTLPWTLSTSQQPQQQVSHFASCDLPEYRDKVSPGGGFGPVADSGYGVSYMVAGDFRIFFHVSSKKNAADTDSEKFMDSLFQSLREMKSLFDGD